MQTLDQAICLARSGKSKNIALAANRLDGVAPASDEMDSALCDIVSWLPHHSERQYKLAEFVAATHEIVGSTGRYVSTMGVSTSIAPDTIIVTRHPALIAYLLEVGAAPEGTPVIEHATPADVVGKRVIGVLPHRLSALCASVVEVPLDIPPELRGVELTLEQVRQYAGEPVEYTVRRGPPPQH